MIACQAKVFILCVMLFTRLKLKNWRNFTRVDLELRERIFITGPNASGKSNLLDAFRFLRDIAKGGGGLQQAVLERGGLTKLRCLAARRDPNVEIEVELRDGQGDDSVLWRYGIGLKQETRGLRRVLLIHEKVWKNDVLILNRPNKDDRSDELRLTETHLEQITANREFRPLADVFQKVLYLHLVPQLLKFPHLANRDAAGEDPFGIKFLDRLMETPEKTRRSRLKKLKKHYNSLFQSFRSFEMCEMKKAFPTLKPFISTGGLTQVGRGRISFPMELFG